VHEPGPEPTRNESWQLDAVVICGPGRPSVILALDHTPLPAAADPARLTRVGSACTVTPDGRVTHFPQAMCRVRTADGRTGTRWMEWNLLQRESSLMQS